MSTDEKYLDDLLKAMTEGDTKPRTMEDVMREMNAKPTGDSSFSVSSEDLADMLDAIEQSGEMENDKEEASADIAVEIPDDINIELPEQDISIDNDEDLAEINGLLNETDRNEAVDDDMLALLESMNDIGNLVEADESEESIPVFDDGVSTEPEEASTAETDELNGKAKKKRAKREKAGRGFGLFGKKKSKDKTAVSGEEASTEEIPFEEKHDDLFAQLDNLEEILEEKSGDTEDVSSGQYDKVAGEGGQASDARKNKKEKPVKEGKPGFFSRILTALTEEENENTSGEVENISSENASILNELEEEDQKEKDKKKKKDKKAGKSKKGKEKKQTDNNDDEQENEDAGASDKKKKKVRESRKEKKAKEEKKEKPVKALSRRNLFLLIAFCATLLACILLLSMFLPEYSDKIAARDAYYIGDYEEAYELLYNKHLNASDKLVFNRAKTVLRLERKLKSYENNLAMGRELEAVDALLQGISCYQDLTAADEYGVRNEVDALYHQICSILESNYGISEEEALEINAYDNQTYTRKLNSVVYGTDFVKPGEKKAEPTPSVPQDILPEEEEIISY